MRQEERVGERNFPGGGRFPSLGPGRQVPLGGKALGPPHPRRAISRPRRNLGGSAPLLPGIAAQLRCSGAGGSCSFSAPILVLSPRFSPMGRLSGFWAAFPLCGSSRLVDCEPFGEGTGTYSSHCLVLCTDMYADFYHTHICICVNYAYLYYSGCMHIFISINKVGLYVHTLLDVPVKVKM